MTRGHNICGKTVPTPGKSSSTRGFRAVARRDDASCRRNERGTCEQGMTLIETVIACAILLVVMLGLLSAAALATSYTENHGHLAARTTEYAQDKMEQLLALAYTDALSNTVVFPATSSGGTGLAVGGSLNTSAPVDGYVDWLEEDGDLLGGGTTPPSTWYYERVWQVTTSSAGVKQVTVATTVRSSFGRAMIPKSTVVALKASQF
jgi:Tfp pilus assembly protein PilV